MCVAVARTVLGVLNILNLAQHLEGMIRGGCHYECCHRDRHMDRGQYQRVVLLSAKVQQEIDAAISIGCYEGQQSSVCPFSFVILFPFQGLL